MWRFWGPGFLVAAAFIGPGTVNTAIRAGGGFGFHFLWSVGFAAITAIIFQGMAARLGLVTGKGLAELLRDFFPDRRLQLATIGIVFGAIIFGNAAYQAGNLAGAATGLKYFVSGPGFQGWLLLSSLAAAFLIWRGTLRTLKIVLTSMVGLMSFTFFVAAIQSQPDYSELLAGCFSFEILDMGMFFAIVGTTVVPYNLFLHSSTVAEQAGLISRNSHGENDSADSIAPDKNSNPDTGADGPDSGAGKSGGEGTSSPITTNLDFALAASRMDTTVAVWLGAIVTASIIVTAAGSSALNFGEAADSLTELIGPLGGFLFFVGLFAAGLTSAITAPLAAGYVFAGCFGYPARVDHPRVRHVALIIIGVGYLFAALNRSSPEQIIFLAQIANGLILPIIAVFLIWVTNSKTLLGQYRNNWQQNLFGGAAVVLVVSLGVFKLLSTFKLVS